MTCAHFVLSLIGLLSIAQETHQSSSVHQEKRLISVNVGDSETLQCSYQEDKLSIFYWYKQSLRQEPKIISIHQSYDRKGTFQDEFKDQRRFTLKNENHSLILIISDIQDSDSATYYCAKSIHGFSLEFSEGTIVFVKNTDSYFNALVQQSDSDQIHPGDSVTLNCSASTESCDGEPSVYWFKNSEDHHPSLIYTQSNNIDQCERKTNNKTHTCVYNLPLNNLDQSKAGTYYCAVTVCGRIVFGNGTRLELKDNLFLVYILGGALVFTIIPLIFLIILTWKRSKSNSSRSTAPPATVTEGTDQTTDDVIYAAPIVSSLTRPGTWRQEECVYSGVKI